jgi:hypothetical protein
MRVMIDQKAVRVPSMNKVAIPAVGYAKPMQIKMMAARTTPPSAMRSIGRRDLKKAIMTYLSLQWIL